jgi:hypothetical protein
MNNDYVQQNLDMKPVFLKIIENARKIGGTFKMLIYNGDAGKCF